MYKVYYIKTRDFHFVPRMLNQIIVGSFCQKHDKTEQYEFRSTGTCPQSLRITVHTVCPYRLHLLLMSKRLQSLQYLKFLVFHIVETIGLKFITNIRDHGGCDHMVVGFTTSDAISVYHH